MKSVAARVGFVLLGLVLGLVLLTAITLMVWEPFAAQPGAMSPARAYRAEIVRDEWGVPHIYGRTDADVAYGIARAHAEDDFFTLQDVVAMTRGRYGAIAGEAGAQFDFALHVVDARGTVARQYDALPADTRALLDGYAAGLNDYAARHPGEIKLARLFPVDGRDIATGFVLRSPFFHGLGNTIGALVDGEALRADPGSDLSSDPRPGLATPLPAPEAAELAGSNAWAIAPGKSPDGTTRLVSNSHQPWRGGVAWYELVIESGEGWHFAGATFPGSPYPFLGHNETLGWTNTVNLPDMTDVYRLVLDESGTRYRLDGEWRDLESREVTLPVRFGPFILPIRRTIHRSVHGPVIRNEEGAFAIRYGGMGSIGQVDAYYRLSKAKDFATWRAVLARQAISSTNFIYADRAGNIAYYYNAAIPDRPEGPDWRGIVPGDRTDLIWQRLAPFESLPHYENPASGYLWNANNAPFLAAGPGSNLNPADFSPLLGIETKVTNRARRAARLMAETDQIDRATLERIKYDTGYERAGYVAETLDAVAALDLSGDPLLARAQALLASWDLTSDGFGRADALALLVLREPMADAYNQRPPGDVREYLADSAAHLVTHFGRLDPPLQSVLRLRQGPGPNAVDLPMDGGSDTLRAATMWNVDADGRLAVKHGDSFVQFVEWQAGRRVSSQTIQPFGAATTRPDSAHFTDQAGLFVQRRLKPVHFWRRDVLANASSRKIVTSGHGGH